MSQSLQDLLAQREALEKAISMARQQQNAAAIAQARDIIAQNNLTVQDVFPGRAGKSTAPKTGTSKVAAKYRNPVNGQTWTGRGKAPKWIEGQNRDQFLIA